MTQFSVRIAPRDLKAVILLVLVALGLHINSLWLGFWYDDNNHLELCRRNGYAGLASGNIFDWDQRIAHVWWARKETGWAYFRPLAVAIRTVELNAFGLNPVPFHIIYLTGYLASVLLLYGAIRRWGGGVGMALTTGLLFTMHPAHALAAAWLACDGPVLVGIWTFLALWLLRDSMDARHRRPGLWLGIFICYALAMLSRESGIMLGPMLVICEWFAAWRRGDGAERRESGTWPRSCILCAAMAVEAVIYLLVRNHYVRGQLAPRSPYFTGPWEPGFASWLFHKALNDFLSLTLSLPTFPIVNVSWLQQRPVTTLGMTLVALAVLAIFFYPLRRSRAAWAVTICMGLSVAPTLLTLSATYHFYFASACWGGLLVLWARQLWPRRPRVAAVTLAGIALTYLAGLWTGDWILFTSAWLEHLVQDSVLATGPAQFPPGTRLFFINLPSTATETGPAIRLASNRPDLEFCPLTLSPDPFLPDGRVIVRKENDRTLLVQAGGDGWFCGVNGELGQLNWFGSSRRDFPKGPVQFAPVAGMFPFRVEVVDADTLGIKTLRFIFDHPIDDPGYRFFVGTPTNGLQPLRFAGDGRMLPPEAPTPEQNRVMRRIRRLHIAYDRVLDILDKFP